MTAHEILIPLFRWITLAGMIFTCVRLLACGLHSRYRVFLGYLAFSSVRSGVLLALDVRSGAYMKFWALTEPVLWVFYILLVLELYSLILERHRGLLTVGRWALYAGFGAALISAFASLAPPASDPYNQSRLITFYLLSARGLLFSLLVFLVLILWFLSHYPVTLSRNVFIHSIVYSLFFLSSSLAFLVRSMIGYEMAQPVNTVLMGISAVSAAAWGLLLTRKGETEMRTLRLSWQPGQEERLIRQLDALNATLLRAARK